MYQLVDHYYSVCFVPFVFPHSVVFQRCSLLAACCKRPTDNYILTHQSVCLVFLLPWFHSHIIFADFPKTHSFFLWNQEVFKC